jgi:citrate lyase synthetase
MSERNHLSRVIKGQGYSFAVTNQVGPDEVLSDEAFKECADQLQKQADKDDIKIQPFVPTEQEKEWLASGEKFQNILDQVFLSACLQTFGLSQQDLEELVKGSHNTSSQYQRLR